MGHEHGAWGVEATRERESTHLDLYLEPALTPCLRAPLLVQWLYDLLFPSLAIHLFPY